MDSALPIRGKICTVSHFIALDPHADPFFPSWFRLNQFAPWEALRSPYQLTMYIWRIIRNQSSWPSFPTARSRLSRVRMGSSSSRESLSDVMVSIRLSLITPIARYICSGSSLKFVLKVLSARRRSEFFSFFLLFFFFFFPSFYPEEILIRIKLQWLALLQTLVFSVEHPRMLLLSINGFILLNLKLISLPILSVDSVAVDSVIANRLVIPLSFKRNHLTWLFFRYTSV